MHERVSECCERELERERECVVRESQRERERVCERESESEREREGGKFTSTRDTTTYLNLELKLYITAVVRILLKIIETSELLSKVVSPYGLGAVAS